MASSQEMVEASLLEHCIRRVVGDVEANRWDVVKATTRGGRVCGFIVVWAQLVDEQGPGVSIEDYIAAGYDSHATSYRRLADFRALFPEEHDPTRIAEVLLATARARKRAPNASMALAL